MTALEPAGAGVTAGLELEEDAGVGTRVMVLGTWVTMPGFALM